MRPERRPWWWRTPTILIQRRPAARRISGLASRDIARISRRPLGPSTLGPGWVARVELDVVMGNLPAAYLTAARVNTRIDSAISAAANTTRTARLRRARVA